jgi:DNA-binding transcriptional regulator YiaG|tara:strand:+ start:424 stop:648 length:225 start_codon:yes stop_codon:yes gene_type:complete
LTPSQIKEFRASLKLSGKAFARLVGVQSDRTVRRWEAGDRLIPDSIGVIKRLLNQLSPTKRDNIIAAARKKKKG